MPNLDWLQSFVAFAEHESFTHAARALHISQPALHAQIAKLSADLGVPLYRRVGRRIELTAHGIEVARFARRTIERVAELRDVLRDGRSRQPVILAAGEGAYLYLLGPAIERFTRDCEAPLRLLTADRQQALDALHSGRAHLAVAAVDALPAASHELRLIPFVEVPQVVVVPGDHPLAGRAEIGLGDMAGLELVVPPPDREHRRALEAALAAASIPWQVAVEASGWELILHFVRLGLGCAVVNGCCPIPDGYARADRARSAAQALLTSSAREARPGDRPARSSARFSSHSAGPAYSRTSSGSVPLRNACSRLSMICLSSSLRSSGANTMPMPGTSSSSTMTV